jgi:uncharacterized protein (DUF2236 family)
LGKVIALRVNAERLALLGWSRAILLQMAHPLIAAGVAEHSSFRATPLAAVSRLRETVRAMLALTFGDPIAHGHAIARIKAIHTRVHGELREAVGVYPAGARYSAEDPALLLWVHATLIESVVLVYEQLVGPLSAANVISTWSRPPTSRSRLGRLTRTCREHGPALEAYLAQEYGSGRISVGTDARMVVDVVLFPPLSAISGPFAFVNRVVTLGLLPPFVRDQYHYAWTSGRESQFKRVTGAIRGLRRVHRMRLALWPEARGNKLS